MSTAAQHTIRFWVSVGFSTLLFIASYGVLSYTDIAKTQPSLTLEIKGPEAERLQLFVTQQGAFNPNYSSEANYKGRGYEKITLPIPPTVNHIEQIRIDLGDAIGTWQIKSAVLKSDGFKRQYDGPTFSSFFTQFNHIDSSWVEAGEWCVRSNDIDAYFISDQYFATLSAKLYQKPAFYYKALILSLLISAFTFAWAWSKTAAITLRTLFSIQWLYIALIASLFIPTLHFLFAEKSFKNTRENRSLTAKPNFDISKPSLIPSQLRLYYNDHFGGRGIMIFTNSYLKLKLAGISARADLVLIGKDGWLYSTDPQIIGDYRRVTLFTRQEIAIIQKHLAEMQQWCAKQQSQFALLVTPSKYTIYPEYLPSQFQFVHTQTNVDLLRTALQTEHSFVYLDVHDKLLRHKKKEDIFYKHDTHWNYRGGFIGYTALMEALGILPHPLSDYSYTFSSRPDADLAQLLALEEQLRKEEYILEPTFPKQAQVVPTPNYPSYAGIQPAVVTEVPDTSLPRLVMFRDSYANLMLPYLSEHFERAVYLWSHRFDPAIILEEKPDIVVFQITEQYLYRLLHPNPTSIR